MNTTNTACPDEPDDSAEAIARMLNRGSAPKHEPNDPTGSIADLLNRQAAVKSRLDKSTPPSPAISASEALQRQALDAESKKLVVLEELAAALRDALTKLPAAVKKEVEERLTVHTEKHENAVSAEGRSIRDAMPQCSDAAVRFLVHVYGWLLLLIVMGGFLFLIFTHR